MIYQDLFNKLKSKVDIREHDIMPVKYVDGVKFCEHGYKWGEGEVIPCKKCLGINKEHYKEDT